MWQTFLLPINKCRKRKEALQVQIMVVVVVQVQTISLDRQINKTLSVETQIILFLCKSNAAKLVVDVGDNAAVAIIKETSSIQVLLPQEVRTILHHSIISLHHHHHSIVEGGEEVEHAVEDVVIWPLTLHTSLLINFLHPFQKKVSKTKEIMSKYVFRFLRLFI